MIDTKTRYFGVYAISIHELIAQHNPSILIDGLTLNCRNALSFQMMEELISAIEKNGSEERLRCIMISSTPGPVFSAGHNLKELVGSLFVAPKQNFLLYIFPVK